MGLCLRAATLAGGLEPLFFSTTSLPFHPFPATWSTAGRRPEQPRMVPPLSCCPLAPGPASPSIRPSLCPASTADSLREQELRALPPAPGPRGPWQLPVLVPRLLSGGAATNPAPWRLRLGARGAWGRHGSGAGGRVDPAAEPLSLLTHSRSSSQIQKKWKGTTGRRHTWRQWRPCERGKEQPLRLHSDESPERGS